MTHLESIEKGLQDKRPYVEIIRKVYLTYPTMALMGNEEKQFSILNEISNFFKIPINNIHVVGSAKTGKSFHKNSAFMPKTSDLDIAIIDSELFQYYSEWAFEQSRGFKNQSAFPVQNGISTYIMYSTFIAKGIFRPDLMPNGDKRAKWLEFFGQLSFKHKDLFSTINAAVYLSQVYFEHKQLSIINNHISNRPV